MLPAMRSSPRSRRASLRYRPPKKLQYHGPERGLVVQLRRQAQRVDVARLGARVVLPGDVHVYRYRPANVGFTPNTPADPSNGAVSRVVVRLERDVRRGRQTGRGVRWNALQVQAIANAIRPVIVHVPQLDASSIHQPE